MVSYTSTPIHRRQSLFLIGGSVFLASAHGGFAQALAPHPILWRVERNGAKVYIFGISEDAKDRSWLTPAIESAFQESQEIWFETPHPDPAGAAVSINAPASGELPKYDTEHDLFAVLDPQLSARVSAAAQAYDVPHDALVHARVWYAFFILNRGYWAWRGKNGLVDAGETPDAVLAQMAWSAHKPIHSEQPTTADQARWFATLPDDVARERLENLLDYFDDEKAGLHADRFDWIYGKPSEHSVQQMSTRHPALYDYEQARRNTWWATQIAKLLTNGGTYFVVIGTNHLLGPESIIKKLRSQGFEPQTV